MLHAKRTFCHEHYYLAHICRAYNKSSKKFCDKLIDSILCHHCHEHTEYNQQCSKCAAVVVPNKLFCENHKHFEQQAAEEIEKKKSNQNQKSVSLYFFYFFHKQTQNEHVYTQKKMQRDARHGVRRSYKKSTEILDTINEDVVESDDEKDSYCFYSSLFFIFFKSTICFHMFQKNKKVTIHGLTLLQGAICLVGISSHFHAGT